MRLIKQILIPIFLMLSILGSHVYADTTYSKPEALVGGDEKKSPSAEAGVVLSNDQDISKQILAKLFGQDILNTINSGGDSVSITDDGGSFLEAMFSIFNGAVLLITVFIGLYILLAGVAQSAHEGKPLGQRFNSLWVPLRTAFAFAMIAPVPVLKGYSAIQAAVIFASLLSVEVANNMMTAGLDYVSRKGSLISPTVNADYEATQMAVSMMTSMTCNNYYEKQGKNLFGGAKQGSTSTINVKKNINAFDKVGFSFIGDENMFGWGKNCGEIYIDCASANKNAATNPMAPAICKAKQQGLVAMHNSLNASVKKMVDDFSEIETTTFTDAIQAYRKTVAQGVKAALDSANNQRSQALTDFASRATAEGWITMGSWYWVVATINNRMYDAGKTTFSYKAPEVPAEEISQENIDSAYKNLRQFTEKLYVDTSKSNEDIAMAVFDMKNTALSIDGEGSSWMLGRALLSFTGVAGSGKQMSDPLIGLGYLGDTLFTPIAVTMDTAAVAGLAGTLFSKAPGVVGKAGEKMQDFSKSITSMISRESSPVLGTVLILGMFAGVALKFYLPLVPFIMWTMGILGWLVMLVESMIAAPLWAAAHALPDGDGIVGNRASQGYQLMINVMLRPILLVMGFFISIIVMWIICWLFLRGFIMAVEGSLSSASWSGYAGIIGSIMLIVIMTGALVVLVNKSFSMIYETADNVMKWIGGGVSGAGEFRGTSEVQGAMQGAVGSGKGALDQALQASAKEQPGGKRAEGKTEINAQGQDNTHVQGNAKAQPSVG